MKKTDYMSLDGKSLAQLQLIYRLGSISAAALQLGVNQSTVSHNLERLRRVLDDPLFIKSGRGLVASAKMEAMQEPIEEVLAALTRVADPLPFDPARCEREFILVANDFEHDIIVPPLFRLLSQEAPLVRLRTVISSTADFDPLNSSRVDVELTPRTPSESSGLIAQPLLQDELQVFYDPNQRAAPRSLDDCLAAQHARVVFENGPNAGLFDRALARRGLQRQVVYSAPSFATMAAVLRGSQLLAVCPSKLAQGALAGLKCCALPIDIQRLSFHMVWHAKYRNSAEHRWFRERISTVSQALRRSAPAS